MICAHHFIALGIIISAAVVLTYCTLWLSATFTALWAPSTRRRQDARRVVRLLLRRDRYRRHP